MNNLVHLGAETEYHQWILSLKNKIKNTQIKTASKVNFALLELYWELAKEIVEKEKAYSWGDIFLQKISEDLKKDFPDMSGFSAQNLKHIRYWYKFYSANITAEIETLIKSIPWGHNQRIMYKCETVNQALFYIQKTLDNGWSRSVLEHQIDSNLYARQGKAITNFEAKLPPMNSDLAKQTLKDPYNFDFLTLREEYDERDLENALVSQITQFLLELGTGFSYIGKQVHIQVGESDFYIDLLFYHVKLHCYVVVELKTEKFKPEFVGKLNFYITAVNKNLKSEQDNPTIGILICKDKDNVVAEYALNEMNQPIGIAEYQLVEKLNQEFKRTLPTIEEIEFELSK
ncbi:MAG: PDDEXK nuclease domain-containing protein [Pasteurellaceae bacterium]|nr:PDDEXK nuclease domain-containing protein [Pasteurellaceae bacterium]